MEIREVPQDLIDQALTRPDNKEINTTIEEARRLILKGGLTPFYFGSDQKTFANPIQCPICYQFFPMINVMRCCKNHLCSACLLASKKDHKCPFCRSPDFKWYSNIPPDEISNDDEKDDIGYQRRNPNIQLPQDIKEVCQEFGYDENEVLELYKNGLQINRLIEPDDL